MLDAAALGALREAMRRPDAESIATLNRLFCATLKELPPRTVANSDIARLERTLSELGP